MPKQQLHSSQYIQMGAAKERSGHGLMATQSQSAWSKLISADLLTSYDLSGCIMYSLLVIL